METANKVSFEDGWLSKPLEVLENDYWGEPEFKSYLRTTCFKLRKKLLKDFDTEDLRIMIGQSISLKYLVPLAIEVLNKNILASGDFYEGDLLISILRSDKDYWKSEVENWKTIRDLFNRNRVFLNDYEETEEIVKLWNDLFEEFEKIN